MFKLMTVTLKDVIHRESVVVIDYFMYGAQR